MAFPYDNTHPYRLILDLHGYGDTNKETAGEDYFGLFTASNNTTVFIALSAINTDWSKGDNQAYVQAVLKAVEPDLCVDTSRVMLEGFSQGAAEVWELACGLPGVFKAAVGHSGGHLGRRRAVDLLSGVVRVRIDAEIPSLPLKRAASTTMTRPAPTERGCIIAASRGSFLYVTLIRTSTKPPPRTDAPLFRDCCASAGRPAPADGQSAHDRA
ncbi:MAG: PHB depolymerase family esterase [Polyangiaceae bacterium]